MQPHLVLNFSVYSRDDVDDDGGGDAGDDNSHGKRHSVTRRFRLHTMAPESFGPNL